MRFINIVKRTYITHAFVKIVKTYNITKEFDINKVIRICNRKNKYKFFKKYYYTIEYDFE